MLKAWLHCAVLQPLPVLHPMVSPALPLLHAKGEHPHWLTPEDHSMMAALRSAPLSPSRRGDDGQVEPAC